jgi:hypothetical protein
MDLHLKKKTPRVWQDKVQFQEERMMGIDGVQGREKWAWK